ARPDRVRLVGVADVQRVAVHLGVHRDRIDADLAASTDDPDRDLAAVRDQDLPKALGTGRRHQTGIARVRLRAALTSNASSKRNVTVLLRGVGVALVLEHLKPGDELRPGLSWLDDVVQVAA